MNDVILNKKVSIERCIRQIRHYDALDHGVPFAQDYLKQDAIAMNLQRSAELTIDIANYLIKKNKLGLPQDSREAFALLYQAHYIDESLMIKLQKMVGFRNVLVHEYTQLNLQIMRTVIDQHLDDLLDFAHRALMRVTNSDD